MVKARDILRIWAEDPVCFVYDNFSKAPGFTGPDPWQEEALAAFPKQRLIAMKACKGPGKTCTLAWLAWNFLSTRDQPNIAAVSITGDNLRDGLWKEMSKWQQYSPYLSREFKSTKTRIFHPNHSDTWWMSARTFPKQGDAMSQADALAGLHQDYIMAILDEVGGIPDAVMATAEAILATGVESRIVMAGNPTHLSGPLYRACTSERHKWYLVTITGDPDDPMRSPRISREWALDQIAKYGRDNPWVQVNVFGNFPQTSMNTLVGPEEIELAMRRNYDQGAVEMAQRRIGVDTARFGDDRTVITKRQGLLVHKPLIFRGLRTNEILDIVLKEASDFDAELIFLDSTGGWSAGVEDGLIQVGASVVPVCFAGKAIDNRYMNKRAEMWFNMAKWIKGGGCLPNDQDLVREIAAAEYTFKGDKMILIDKEQMKETIGFSPDIADSIALTFAMPDMPTASYNGMNIASRVDWDYNPFEHDNGKDSKGRRFGH